MTRTIALIQARVSSSRLPGKVLEPLGAEPMIVYMARRVRQSRLLDDVVIVTSTDPSDDALHSAVLAAGLHVFRGDLHDVLSRYVNAARLFEADVIVRLTGDCPLADPAVIDAVLRARQAASADYASNVDPPTYPDGYDVECFTRKALEQADLQARKPAEREHVTVWMRSAAAELNRVNVRCLADLSHLRLTVDYQDDMAAVRRIVEHESSGTTLDLFDVLRILAASPDILSMNPHARNEGLAKSLAMNTHLPGAKP